jgi:hypothetical protein
MYFSCFSGIPAISTIKAQCFPDVIYHILISRQFFLLVVKLNHADFLHAVVYCPPAFSLAAAKLFFTGIFITLKAKVNTFFPVAGFGRANNGKL